MNYYRCECGSEKFVKTHNVWNELLMVKIHDDESWEIEELGVEKTHPIGYICAKCRQDVQELNDGL